LSHREYNDEYAFWLAFSLVPGIGTKRITHLLNTFGSLAAAWEANENRLRQADFDGAPLKHLLEFRKKLNLTAEVNKVKRVGASLLTLLDEGYPALLKTLPDAPPLLYVLGTLYPQDGRALAIVGTRKATKYGRDAAHDLSKQLAGQGVTIISGLAHGIDTVAHQGSIEGGGRTIAVLGSGIDIIYPRENRDLARKIIEYGALVSEFPIGMQPDKRNFPRRNRVISGMALGVLVVEAPLGSGALITAETAGYQGRDVFAIPASIYNPMGSGTNRLIQDGAKLIMNANDILTELNIAHTNIQARATTEHISPANATEAALLQHLNAEPLHVDDLVRLSQLSISVVMSTLTILELKGLAQMVGHMQYCLTYR
jgi:DNA processing protein